IVEDSLGNFWVATMNGINYFDRSTQQFTRYMHQPDDPTSLSAAACRSIFLDSQGTLWAGTGEEWLEDTIGGLNRYRPETGDFAHYFHQAGDSTSLTSNKVTAMYEDSQGNFWVGAVGDGLHLMDRKRGTFQRFQEDNPYNGKLSIPVTANLNYWNVHQITEDQQQRLWLSSFRGGFRCYDPATGFLADLNVITTNGILQEDAGWMIFPARDGTIWMCTAGAASGVYRVTIEASPFHHHALASSNDAALSFCEDSLGTVWIGTAESGLWYWKNQKYQIEQRVPLNGLDRIITDGRQQLWLLNKDQRQLWRWEMGTSNLVDLSAAAQAVTQTIDDICLGPYGQLWLLDTQQDVVAVFNPITNQFTSYSFKHKADLLSSLKNGAIIRSQHRSGIWIVGFTRNERDQQLTTTTLLFNTKSYGFDPIVADSPSWSIYEVMRDPPKEGHEPMLGDIAIDPRRDWWTLTDEVLLMKSNITHTITAMHINN
ncbi:MAG: two-component regulator propeller domain-containing protein, partial [Bacteroidota bacterium]